MTTHEVLVRARALIDTREKWAHRAGLIGRDGRHCTVSAIGEVYDSDNEAMGCMNPATLALMAVLNVEEPYEVVVFNDTHTHAEVVALLDKAIAATAPEPDTSFLNEVRVEEPVAS